MMSNQLEILYSMSIKDVPVINFNNANCKGYKVLFQGHN